MMVIKMINMSNVAGNVKQNREDPKSWNNIPEGQTYRMIPDRCKTVTNKIG